MTTTRLVLSTVFLLVLSFALAISPGLCASNSPPYTKPEDVVYLLYRDYAFEAVISHPNGTTLVDEPEEILSKYFDRELTAMIKRDRTCVERTHEICALDFVPHFASQDPSAYDMEIRMGSAPDKVRVSFMSSWNRELTEIDYLIVETGNSWRIADIIYKEGHTLRGILSDPFWLGRPEYGGSK